jgi:hypothetical protein
MSGPAVTGVQRALDSESGRTGIMVHRNGCKSVSVKEWNLPTDPIKATLAYRKLSGGWVMGGTFESDPPNADVCGRFGEYRQWVKGRFMRNGQPEPKRLPYGKLLQPDTFSEDGDIVEAPLSHLRLAWVHEGSEPFGTR